MLAYKEINVLISTSLESLRQDGFSLINVIFEKRHSFSSSKKTLRKEEKGRALCGVKFVKERCYLVFLQPPFKDRR